MGILEVNTSTYQITIISNIFLYGNAISEEVRRNMQEEICALWNEPRALIWMEGMPYLITFDVKAYLFPDLKKHDILTDKNPRNNYFRIEEFSHSDISFVDGLGCNTGYFKVENLYLGSTTAAHEYGHTLNLPHPVDLDLRGKGVPGIMYPRGTLVDAQFQYDMHVKAGEKGGTLYPIHRKVLKSDIDDLKISTHIENKQRVIGKFSSVYHEPHQTIIL